MRSTNPTSCFFRFITRCDINGWCLTLDLNCLGALSLCCGVNPSTSLLPWQCEACLSTSLSDSCFPRHGHVLSGDPHRRRVSVSWSGKSEQGQSARWEADLAAFKKTSASSVRSLYFFRLTFQGNTWTRRHTHLSVLFAFLVHAVETWFTVAKKY